MPKLDLTSAVSTAANQQQPKNAVNEKKSVKDDNTILQGKSEDMAMLKYDEKKSDLTPSKPTLHSKELFVAPDIFVSLKKGVISDFYKIGKTLGEGKPLFLWRSL